MIYQLSVFLISEFDIKFCFVGIVFMALVVIQPSLFELWRTLVFSQNAVPGIAFAKSGYRTMKNILRYKIAKRFHSGRAAMKWFSNFSFGFLILLLPFSLQAPLCTRFPLPSDMVVSVAVADLRSAPEAIRDHVNLPTSDLTNPLQETQLLLGEKIIADQQFFDIFGKKWLYVHATAQDHFSFMLGWHKYRGWIQADQATSTNELSPYNLVVKNLLADVLDQNGNSMLTVSIGTRFVGSAQNGLWRVTLPSGQEAWIHDSDVYPIAATIQESIQELRKNIVATAMKFQGSYYSWGGRSAQNTTWKISGVDCSGLINLAFLAHGFQIPRMSNDQYLSSHHIKSGSELQLGDLVLFDPVHKDRTPHHMTHVMMYVGDGQLLEATFADASIIRTISFYDRIGKQREDTMSGDVTDTIKVNNDIDDTEYFVYFCSYFTSPGTLQRLRDNARQQTWKPEQLAIT